MVNDSLGDRMRGYKAAYDHVLTGRTPVLVHVDGIGFSRYTRKCEKPFDARLGDVMMEVARGIVERAQGAVFTYAQSDEITVLLHGYKSLSSQPYRGNRVQKLVSDFSGPPSAHFTRLSHRIWDPDRLEGVQEAAFAAAVFLVPENDVTNFFLWRQKDAMRNSVQMLARSLYSHKQVNGKNVVEMKDMCRAKGSPWEKLDHRWQRGACVYRASERLADCGEGKWFGPDKVHTDLEIPLFNLHRDYVERHLALEEG